MRDARKKKRMDLRKSHLASRNPCTRSLFESIFPEYDTSWRRWTWRHWNPDLWEICWNAYHDWVYQELGIRRDEVGVNVPAFYRRHENSVQRNKEKMALRVAVRDNDWDDFCLPRKRRDVRWKYW